MESHVRVLFPGLLMCLAQSDFYTAQDYQPIIHSGMGPLSSFTNQEYALQVCLQPGLMETIDICFFQSYRILKD